MYTISGTSLASSGLHLRCVLVARTGFCRNIWVGIKKLGQYKIKAQFTKWDHLKSILTHRNTSIFSYCEHLLHSWLFSGLFFLCAKMPQTWVCNHKITNKNQSYHNMSHAWRCSVSVIQIMLETVQCLQFESRLRLFSAVIWVMLEAVQYLIYHAWGCSVSNLSCLRLFSL